MLYKIAILGDFNPAYSTLHALNDSTRQVKKLFTDEIQFDWIGTDIFNAATAFNNLYSGLWIAPGSPYKNMQHVLDTIKYVRTDNIPTLGNCGGFQHMIIEFARNVCGITLADHEETNPGSPDLLIAKLSCSLVEQQEQLTICDKNSLLFNIIQQEQLMGKYFCSYGLNKSYSDQLKSSGLKLTALSSDGEVRAFEIAGHPFFMGTLFQPALTSTADEPDPIIAAFVKKCMAYKINIGS
jgi:CTP synthase (UTP-ammonia lyase)